MNQVVLIINQNQRKRKFRMVYVARNGETEKLYLVAATDEDEARTRLGDMISSDGDEFSITSTELLVGETVVDISDRLL